MPRPAQVAVRRPRILYSVGSVDFLVGGEIRCAQNS